MKLLIVRRPVFGRDQRVHAYDLRCRPEPLDEVFSTEPPLEVSMETRVSSLLSLGLDRLSNGLPAILQPPVELLESSVLEHRPPVGLIIDIPLSELEARDELVSACHRHRALGYRFVLSGLPALMLEPALPAPELLKAFELIRFDLSDHTEGELEALVREASSQGLEPIAVGVDTPELYELANRIGFDLLEGEYYCSPEALARPEHAVRQLSIIRVMGLLRDPNAALTELEEAFESDQVLEKNLMRIANSAAYGNLGIDTMARAIQFLGRERLYRWLAIFLVTSVGEGSGIDRELVRKLLIRARFCELLADSSRPRSAKTSLFIVGLFSLLDLILDRPMEEIVKEILVTEDAARALLSREGALAPILELVEAYERAEWERVEWLAERVGVPLVLLPDLYIEALGWTKEQLDAPAV